MIEKSEVKTTRETMAQLDFCHLLVLLLLCYSQYSDPLKNIQPAASSGNNNPQTQSEATEWS